MLGNKGKHCEKNTYPVKEMFFKKSVKTCRLKLVKKEENEKQDETEEIEAEFINMHSDVQFFINEYVAVSYQDNWYPGMVQKVAKDLKTLTVNCLARTNNTGHFIWPNRKDEQEVNTVHIKSWFNARQQTLWKTVVHFRRC
ncbi:hypothetical protein DPMN_002681 [Dreissena polymorpha]|uniref:Uncharacterized protein n=1 Tax=Dreissena polymorpha TaxID=45954 RepID=A0A9D4MJL1_DREPO|nr:hypothetical protein DPMN_002681 [Dreissena polymorpha]